MILVLVDQEKNGKNAAEFRKARNLLHPSLSLKDLYILFSQKKQTLVPHCLRNKS
jgi:hypothetical protein